MIATDILLERETANDESALIVAVFVASGSAVDIDTLLFETENSKATQEVRAPSAGILSHALAVGQNVAFGVPIAQISSAAGAASAPLKPSKPAMLEPPQPPVLANGHVSIAPLVASNLSPAPALVAKFPGKTPTPETQGATTEKLPERLTEPRVSHAAAQLLAEHGLSASAFDVDFVSTQDVRAHLGWSQPALPSATSQMQTETPSPLQTETPSPSPQASIPRVADSQPSATFDTFPALRSGQLIGRRKRAEIESLKKGAGATMLSVLGTTLGPLTVTREPGDFLNGRITDLVLYESSRLMRKFPRLNSFFEDGQFFSREFIHAGLAIDSGERLVVYGIENADQLSLRDLSDTMGDAVARYMESGLTAGEMTRATFTVTDLSADELDFVLPLLPRGQALILGITHSAALGFRIFAGFDHRITEGREVAIFLGELRDRLLSFASAQPGNVVLSVCAYCARSVDEAVLKGKEKGLLKVVVRDGSEVLCCASCWNGW